MPGIRRQGVDGVSYGAGYQAYTLKIRFEDNPYAKIGKAYSGTPGNRPKGSNAEGWDAGWLDARDEWTAYYMRDTEAQNLARSC